MIAEWPYESMILDIFIPIFHQKGEGIIPSFVNNKIPNNAFLSAYKYLEPIEKMDEKEKIEMKQYVCKLFPNKSPKDKLNACKIIYTIGNLL